MAGKGGKGGKKGGKAGQSDGTKLIAGNRRAGQLYHLGERFEAGIVLAGTEVKSAREGGVTLKDGYVRVAAEQAYLVDVHIAPYSHAGYSGHEPERPRKLLLHKRELRKLQGKLTRKGLTLVPVRMYLKNGRIKLELALAEGKKLHMKRDEKRAEAADRDAQRALSER